MSLSSDISISHRGRNRCVGVLDTKPIDEGVDESDEEHDHLDDEDDEDDNDESDDEGNHQDDVVQDLRARMAVLVVDVDHGNQKEQEADHNLKVTIDDSRPKSLCARAEIVDTDSKGEKVNWEDTLTENKGMLNL